MSLSNKEKSLVSVVVAVYNGAKTLPRCLDSLVKQSYKNIEIICVNDCSSDNSLDIINDFCDKYSNIQIINHSENKNGGGADNTGIRVAKGQYICIVDQDDWLELDAIKVLVRKSSNGRVDVVLGQWQTVSETGETVVQKNMIVGGTLEENIRYSLLYGCRILGGLFKRNLFVDNNLWYPENVNWADNSIFNAILITATSIEVVGTVNYNYFIGDNSSSSNNISIKSIKDRIFTTNLCYDNCKKVDKNCKYEEEIKYRYLFLTCTTIKLISNSSKKDAFNILQDIIPYLKYCLHNKYLYNFTSEEILMLKRPKSYIHKIFLQRMKKSMKESIHKVRHISAAAIKRLIGIDPTKSIFEKNKI